LVYEFIFKKLDKKSCLVAVRFLNTEESPVPEKLCVMLFKQMQLMAKQLKEYCEQLKESSFS